MIAGIAPYFNRRPAPRTRSASALVCWPRDFSTAASARRHDRRGGAIGPVRPVGRARGHRLARAALPRSVSALSVRPRRVPRRPRPKADTRASARLRFGRAGGRRRARRVRPFAHRPPRRLERVRAKAPLDCRLLGPDRLARRIVEAGARLDPRRDGLFTRRSERGRAKAMDRHARTPARGARLAAGSKRGAAGARPACS